MRALPFSLAILLLAHLAPGPPRAAAQHSGPAAHADLWVGIGAVPPLALAGPERGPGAMALGAVEVGGGRVRLRVEGGIAGQPLREDVAGQVTGDAQTVHAAVALRVPLRPEEERIEPYLLAGAAVMRPSTRIRLRSLESAVPDAAFAQTTSEVAGGALLAAGFRWRMSRARAFLEARWMGAATEGERTSSLPLVLGLSLPLRR